MKYLSAGATSKRIVEKRSWEFERKKETSEKYVALAAAELRSTGTANGKMNENDEHDSYVCNEVHGDKWRRQR